MSNIVTNHADALDVLRGALPGARVTVNEYPRRRASDRERPNERLWQAETRRLGSQTGIVCGAYKLPCSVGELASYAKRRVDDAIKQRQGRTDVVGETFMATGQGLEDVTLTHDVRA